MSDRRRPARGHAVAPAVVLGFLLWCVPFHAVMGQGGSSMLGKALEADPGIVNAAQALESSLAALATRGESVRGASGTLASLLIESDDLICNAWIIAFRARIQAMIVLNTQPGAPEDLALTDAIRRMQELRVRVEAACQKVQTGTTGGGGGAPEPDPDPEQPPEGRSRDTRYTVAEQVCMDRCGEQYWRYYRAFETAQRERAKADRSQEAADEADAKAAEAEARVGELEQAVEEAKAEISQLASGGGPRSAADQAALDRATDRYATASNALRLDRQRAREARNAARKAEQRAETDAGRARRADLAMEEALRAYEECVRSCVEQARRAGEAVDPGRLFLYDRPPASAPSSAGTRHAGLSLDARVGYTYYNGFHETLLATDGVAAATGDRSPLSYGLSARYHPMGLPFGLTAGIRTGRRGFTQSYGVGTEVNGTIRDLNVDAGLCYTAPAGPMFWELGLGLVWAWNGGELRDESGAIRSKPTHNALMGTFGAGLHLPLGDRFGIVTGATFTTAGKGGADEHTWGYLGVRRGFGFPVRF